jgi:hypothetical protein
VSKATSGGLPAGLRNAAERRSYPHYIGALKDLTGRHPKQLPIRTYTASCDLDEHQPRMFVSMTLEDTSASADPDIPTIGSVFETIYDPVTKTLSRTGNETTIGLCQETHGLAVSADCSRVAVLCNTDYEEPVSETEHFTRDLIAEHGDSWMIQPNNEAAINARFTSQAERDANYKYNGEMWLLEWNNGAALTSNPDRYVIHKAVGGQQFAASTLVYAEDQDAYGAAFTSNVFDSGGGRHKSGALLVIDRNTWTLNPPDPNNNNRDRGWRWDCAGGHVIHMRAFFNPFVGHFGALCTSDGTEYWDARNAGAIGVKMETSSSTFGGYENYIVAASNGGVTNGGGHKLLPVDADKSIVVLAGAELAAASDPDFLAMVQDAEQSAASAGLSFTGLDACGWAWGEPCLRAFLNEYEANMSDRYPGVFRGGFWGGDITAHDLTKIGLMQVAPDGSAEVGGTYRSVKWIVEDDDCMLGAPQLADLQNGRYLLGYAKFQCISDGEPLQRFAGAHTLHPKEFYLMEIDADGNPLTQPARIEGTGWGSADEMVSLGPGRAAWTYIPDPEIHSDGGFTDPYQADWELMVYESPLN